MSNRDDIVIKPDELGNLPISPPRRSFADFVPNGVKTFLFNHFGWFAAPTAYETWLIKSLFLRVFYQSYRTKELSDVGTYHVGKPGHVITGKGSKELN